MAQKAVENVGSGLPIWIEIDKNMNSDTPVTDAAFEAFLHCDTKAYLLHESIDGQSEFGGWEEGLIQQFRQRVSEWLRSSFGDDEVYIGTPSPRMLKKKAVELEILHPRRPPLGLPFAEGLRFA